MGNFEMLYNLPKLIKEEQNSELLLMPDKEEVRSVVVGLNRCSAGGPDGITGIFFQETWDILGDHIHQVANAFHTGSGLPRFITHTNLALLPKKVIVSTFSDPRPISLSDFINKIFSRIIHERNKKLLRSIISSKQPGFVQERSIAENILLVQEIITDIRKRGKPPNLVIKQNMMKAYDRIK